MSKLFYREYGNGKPLIILHGLLGSSDNWLLHGKLFAKTFNVFIIDQMNHGNSPHSQSINYKTSNTYNKYKDINKYYSSFDELIISFKEYPVDSDDPNILIPIYKLSCAKIVSDS